jgi:hypothetical protein
VTVITDMKPLTAAISLVALAALATMTYAIWELVAVGTCASGGPYVSARECPDGTGVTSLILTASILVYVTATIAAAFQDQAAGGFWFGMLFTVLGGAFLASAITNHAPGDGGVGWFLGALFLAMGILPAAGSIILMVRGRSGGTFA